MESFSNSRDSSGYLGGIRRLRAEVCDLLEPHLSLDPFHFSTSEKGVCDETNTILNMGGLFFSAYV